MLAYPLRLLRNDEGRTVAIFPDVPEATFEAADEASALKEAQHVLEEALRTHLRSHGQIPPPSEIPGLRTVATDMFVIQQAYRDWPSPISGGRR